MKRNQQGSKMDDTIGSQRCLHLQFSWVLNWSGVLNWATGYKLTPNSPGKFGLSINLTTNHFSKRMQKKKTTTELQTLVLIIQTAAFEQFWGIEWAFGVITKSTKKAFPINFFCKIFILFPWSTPIFNNPPTSKCQVWPLQSRMQLVEQESLIPLQRIKHFRHENEAPNILNKIFKFSIISPNWCNSEAKTGQFQGGEWFLACLHHHPSTQKVKKNL